MSELRLHRKIYKPSAVRAVLADFAEFGTFELRREGDYTLVEIRDPDPDFADILPHEIANSALAETVDQQKA